MGTPGQGRALVTGASAGFGAALARRLAERGFDLIITARRGDRLRALAEELQRTEAVTVDVIELDLAAPGAPEKLLELAGPRIDLLVNNAGLGDYRPFIDMPLADVRHLLAVDLFALSELSHRFLHRARALGRPVRLANVASMVAWYPIPDLAVYAAGKAYVRCFTEALAAEHAAGDTTVSCVCLGAVATEFYDVAGSKPRALYRSFLIGPDRAARVAARGILRGRRIIKPGWVNHAVAAAAWLLPRRLMGAMTRWLLGPPRHALPPAAGAPP